MGSQFCMLLFLILTLAFVQSKSAYESFVFSFQDSNKEIIANDLKKHLQGPVEDVQPPPAIFSRIKRSTGLKPEIYSMHINTDIRFRYSITQVNSHVSNPDSVNSNEVTFQIVLPQSAFISKFIMEIDGKLYEAYVKEKTAAKNIYTEAKRLGQSTGLVEVNSRDSNTFSMNINIKPAGKIIFNLTYEELLMRKLGRYEQTINISPDQATNVRDFKINTRIIESQNLTILRVPNLRTDEQTRNTIDNNDLDNPDVNITRPSGNSAKIEWSPTKKDLALFARNGNNNSGWKFIVQYDIERPAAGGEILLMDGYFVHFFSPQDVLPLRKHVIFLLDVSGSMYGRKIEQLRSAMSYVLDDLKPEDYFNIMTFSNDVKHWNSDPTLANEHNLRTSHNFVNLLRPDSGTNINSALIAALNLAKRVKSKETPLTTTTTSRPTTTRSPEIDNESNDDDSFEFDYSVPESAARLTLKDGRLPSDVESIILFLTDGEPTTGIIDHRKIWNNTREANRLLSIPIYSLAFGDGADFPFVKTLSLQNFGFARKIYEASDADLQLQGFYKEISSPLLSNINFKYTTNETSSIAQITNSKFSKVFNGSELAIAGRVLKSTKNNNNSARIFDDASHSPNIVVSIDAKGRNGVVEYGTNNVLEYNLNDNLKYTWIDNNLPRKPEDNLIGSNSNRSTATSSVTFMEKLWAYITIKQLLEKHESGLNETDSNEEFSDEVDDSNLPPIVNTPKDKEPPKERALRLSLKYGFVTSLTSLVIVKPNDTVGSTDATIMPTKTNTVSSRSSYASSNKHYFTSRNYNRHASPPPPVDYLVHNFRQNPKNYRLSGNSGRGVSRMTAVDNYDEEEDWTFYSRAAHAPYSDEEDINPGFSGIPAGTTRRPTYRPTNLFAPSVRPTYRPTIWTTSENPAAQTTSTSTSTRRQLQSLSSYSNLKLDNIGWLQRFFNDFGEININGTNYRVFSGWMKHLQGKEYDCKIQAIIDLNDNITTGQCRHLKDCVQSEFVNDFDVYSSSYFCPLRIGRTRFAGVCCPNSLN